MSRLTIDLSEKDHKRFKTTASLMGITMRELVIISVNDFMNRKMNKVTEKTLMDSEAKKNLKRFDSLEDLFEDLGI